MLSVRMVLRRGIVTETDKKLDVDSTMISRFWHGMNLWMLDSDQSIKEVCKDQSFFFSYTGARGRKNNIQTVKNVGIATLECSV